MEIWCQHSAICKDADMAIAPLFGSGSGDLLRLLRPLLPPIRNSQITETAAVGATFNRGTVD